MMTNDQIKKLYAKAQSAQKAGRLDEAEKAYARILRSKPGLAEVQFNLGVINTKRRRIPAAAAHFEAALKAKPGQPAIWLAYLDMASLHPKIDNLDSLLARVGSSLDAHPELAFLRGLVAKGRGDAGQACALFEEALARGLASPRALTELGTLLAAEGDTDAALSKFDAALALEPKNDLALARKADLLRNLGQYDAALDTARAAIEAAPKAGALYYTYASIKKMQAGDPMIAKMQALLRKLDPKDRGRVSLGHALAKAMEDTGQQDQVWRYLDMANGATAKAFPYDIAPDQKAFEQNQTRFSQLPTPAALSAPQSPTPIFVTGMPRSGTTLVEQIIASHSDCAGGGELALLGPELAQAFEQGGTEEALRQAGDRYRAKLAQRFPGAGHVTDKSISSYAMIGFIRHALPDAKIIVVRRDPGDNALSVYKNLFAGGTHRYAADLRHIASFFRLFEAQLAYWAKALPGSFSQIKYEELIANPEPQSRQLVVDAGLGWEDACLSFYNSARRVDTLSTTQVRQPIYSSSVGAWKRFGAEMTPFWEAYSEE